MILVLLKSLLGLLFVVLSGLTLTKSNFVIKNYNNLKLPTWFHYIIGVCQLLGGIFIIVGIRNDILAIVSSGLLSLMMLVAVTLHFKKKDKMVGVLPSLSVGIIALIIFIASI